MFPFHKESVKVSSDPSVFDRGPAWPSAGQLMASCRYYSNEIVNPGTDGVEHK